MNPFDFIRADSGSSLFPILVFIIWIIASIVSGMHKRKKRREQLQSHGKPEKAESAGILEHLKRELETQFAEKRSSAEEQSLETGYGERAEAAETLETHDTYETLESEDTFDTRDVAYQNYETTAEKPSPAVSEEQPVAAALPAFREEMAAYSFELTPAAAEGKHESVLSIGDIDEARRGVLWSEVLGPPVALRE